MNLATKVEAVPSAVEDDWQGFLRFVEEALAESKLAFEKAYQGHQYRSPAFELARRLKALPFLADLEAEDAGALLDRALRELHPDEKFVWEALVGDSDSHGNPMEPFTDFLCAWDKCKAYGDNPLQQAVARARESPQSDDYFGERLASPMFAGFREFLRVAEELQVIQKDEPIFLPGPTLGDLLNCSPQQIGQWHKLGVKYGYLEVEKKAKGRMATEFLFHPPT